MPHEGAPYWLHGPIHFRESKKTHRPTVPRKITRALPFHDKSTARERHSENRQPRAFVQRNLGKITIRQPVQPGREPTESAGQFADSFFFFRIWLRADRLAADGASISIFPPHCWKFPMTPRRDETGCRVRSRPPFWPCVLLPCRYKWTSREIADQGQRAPRPSTRVGG